MMSATRPDQMVPSAPEPAAPDPVLAEMLRGYPALEQVVDDLDLSWWQRVQLRLMVLAVHLYRFVILPFRRTAVRELETRLESLRGARIRALGPRSGLPHFPESERQAFERDGVIGPFPAMPRAEARAVAAGLCADFDAGFGGETVLDDAFAAELARHGAWSKQMAGMHQGLRMPELRDVIRRPAIAQRLAGILGDDVMCWRTQFFEKAPGAAGTFWHQTSTFRESSAAAKLEPTRPMDEAIVQLTVWMALTEVTIDTGALRIMPGSFSDGRIEHLYYFAKDNLGLFLSLVPSARLATYLAVARFATGNFVRSQAVLEAAVDLLDASPFTGRTVRDLEMQPGDCVIFTSMNMHGSHANTTADRRRLALVARCIPGHVRVSQPVFDYPTPDGRATCALPDVTCFQVHGTDAHGINRVIAD